MADERKYLAFRASRIQGEGFVVFGVQTKLEHLFLVYLMH
jgi:hypothetical protein